MSYNTRNPAVKRLMREALELSEPTELYHAKPLEDNLFEWHFTIRGPADTDFDGGIYHGRIILPTDYPMKPPNILLLTANGRFEVNRKICLSISGYHPETWRPSWSIRTALLAIIGFMPSHGVGAIGSLDYPPEQRKRLAKESVNYCCSECGPVENILLPLTQASQKDTEEAQSLASQITFHEPKADKGKEEKNESPPNTPTVKEEKTEASTSSASAETVAQSSAPDVQLPQVPPPASLWWMMNPMAMSMGMSTPPAPFPNSSLSTQQQPLSFVEWLEQVKRIQISNAPECNNKASEGQNATLTSPQPTAGAASSSTASAPLIETLPNMTATTSSVRQRASVASPSINEGTYSPHNMPVTVPPPPSSPIDRLLQLFCLMIVFLIFYIIARNLLIF